MSDNRTSAGSRSQIPEVARLRSGDYSAECFRALAKFYSSTKLNQVALGYALLALSRAERDLGAHYGLVAGLASRVGARDLALKCSLRAIAAGGVDRKHHTGELQKHLAADHITAQGLAIDRTPEPLVGNPFRPLFRKASADSQPFLFIFPESMVNNYIFETLEERGGVNAICLDYFALAKLSIKFDSDLFFFYLVGDLNVSTVLYRHHGMTDRSIDLRAETLLALRETWKTAIVALYYDLAKQSLQRIYRAFLTSTDIAVALDGPFGDTRVENSGVTHLDLWTPLPAQFALSDRDRPYDVGFAGAIPPHYKDRRDCIAAIEKSPFKFEGRGKTFGKWMTQDDYVAFHQECKIVVNFSGSDSVSPYDYIVPLRERAAVVHNLKGRVLESIACGALLFESKNPVTPHYFTPGKDYVEFDNTEDLLAKLQIYLDDDALRQKVAASGHQKYRKTLTARHFWDRVFEALEPVWQRRKSH